MLSNIGFFLGMVGLVIGVIPFFDANNPHIYNMVLPVLFGIVGLTLIFKVKKELNDDIVKAGLFVNPLAIFLGITQLVIYLIK